MKDTVAIIQARTSSTRLPGKVLKPILGRPMLELMLSRLEGLPCPLVVATSVEGSDDPVEALCNRVGVHCVRGNLHDVLGRFLEVLERFPASTVVRMTADNPLSDVAGVKNAIAAFHQRPRGMEGVSNHLSGRTDPHGYCFEVVEASALREIHAGDPTSDELEHVTFGLRARGTYAEYSIANRDLSQLRWTVDYPEDYEYMGALFDHLGPEAGFDDAVEWSLSHPHPGNH